MRDLTLDEVIAGLHEAHDEGLRAGIEQARAYGLSETEIEEGMKPLRAKMAIWLEQSIAVLRRRAEFGTHWRQ